MEHVTETTYFRYYTLHYMVKIQCTGGKNTRYKRLIYGENIVAGIPLIVLLLPNFNAQWEIRN